MPTKRPRKSPRDRGASILLYTSATLVLISFALAIALSYAGSRQDGAEPRPGADDSRESAARPAPADAATDDGGRAPGPAMTDTGPAIAPHRRITSYNVCYTKLLR